jgi:hypothetical protein
MSVLHQDSAVVSRGFVRKSGPESDDDTWSSGSSQSSEGNNNNNNNTITNNIPPSQRRWPGNYLLCDDYFGLNHLVENMKIGDTDSPLLLCMGNSNVANGGAGGRAGRRVSWESDGSDPSSVRSPTMEKPVHNLYAKHVYPQYNNNNKYNKYNNNSKYTTKYPSQLPAIQHTNKPPQDRLVSSQDYQRPLQHRPVMLQDNTTSINEMVFPDVVRPQPQHAGLPPPPAAQPGGPVVASPPPPPPGSTPLRVCVFCRNNGESESVFTSHILKDTDGRTLCPILRAYTCPICKANGDRSHTIKYCPMNQGHRAHALNGAVSPSSHLPPTPLSPQHHQQPHHHSFQRYNGDFRLAVSPANLTVNRHPFVGKLRQ